MARLHLVLAAVVVRSNAADQRSAPRGGMKPSPSKWPLRARCGCVDELAGSVRRGPAGRGSG